MSLKNKDEHNRWRNKTVAFRVSPEEWKQIERYVQLSGLTKQDYITRRLINKEVVVQGNPRVYKALRNNLAETCVLIQKGKYKEIIVNEDIDKLLDLIDKINFKLLQIELPLGGKFYNLLSNNQYVKDDETH